MQKKYEKAKDRFKLQRAKNEETLKKAGREHMENEKRHWRTVAQAQEEAEWERLLRIRTQALIEFVETETRFEVEDMRRAHTRELEIRNRCDSPIPRCETVTVSMMTERIIYDCAIEDEDDQVRGLSSETRASSEETTIVSRDHRTPSPAIWYEVSPEHRQPSTEMRLPLITNTPKRIPMNFGPQEPSQATEDDAVEEFDNDKENLTPQHTIPQRPPFLSATSNANLQTPLPRSKTETDQWAALKTPLTIDRAAALAAIQYRRGRAKSFMNAQQTPRKVELDDLRRDISAPPGVGGLSAGMGMGMGMGLGMMGCMSVGRKK